MILQKLKIQKDIDKQSGIATVETAIVITVLIVLLLVSAEFGRLFYHSNEFNKSVRNTARYLSNNSISPAMLVAVTDADSINAKKLLIYGDIIGDNSEIGNRYTLFPGLAQDDIIITVNGLYVTVEAEWEYLTMFGSTLPGFGISSGDSFTLKSASTLRALE
jgi:hypothetical protein